MPKGEQHDIDMAYLLVNHLGIKHYEINVKDAVEKLIRKANARGGNDNISVAYLKKESGDV